MITNCEFLENELMDVARLFKTRPFEVLHNFHFDDGVFHNDFVIDGEKFSFSNEGIAKDEIEFKRLERRFAKLGFYAILSEKYNQKMPWGALTGIRPTKLAYTERENGRDFKELFALMQVSKENTALVERVLKAQERIYERKDKNTDLFVSIPFCPTKCAYCSFITAPIEKTRCFLPEYLKCLEREIIESKPLIGNLRSIYIGGGTPFALSVTELERVLKPLDALVGVEYTVEAGRPDVFDKEKLELLKSHGVTRVCINPQTFSDKTLELIGRKHTVADVYKAFEMTDGMGFDVNVDLIAGLEGETVETFADGVRRAVETGAENITVHCLSLKSGAKLKEECSYIENDTISEMIKASREILTSAGYEPYYMYRQKYQAGNNENVGWSKKGKECTYNIDIMEETADNLALGSNAVSKRVFTEKNRIERFASPKDFKTYFEKIDEIMQKREKFFKKEL